jgi:hypothetical protein
LAGAFLLGAPIGYLLRFLDAAEHILQLAACHGNDDAPPLAGAPHHNAFTVPEVNDRAIS